MEKETAKVYLIGGAPGAGKSTLGRALARRLGIASLTVDDLVVGAQAITTSASHPGLHVMRQQPSVAYFTTSPLEQLQADATQQHEAVWPMVERLVRQRAAWGPPLVIDGWHIRPSWVAELQVESLWAGWIVASAEVLRAREAEVAWYEQSPDPSRMRENFLARSLWYNVLIEEEARRYAMPILAQTGEQSVEQLCDQVLESAGG